MGRVIVGVGIDVVDIARFGQTLERTPRLRERLFSRDEQQLALPSLAARFAVKEAVAKALGAPVGLSWTDAAVSTDGVGRPRLLITGAADRLAERLGIATWHVSISHDAGIASAVVIAEGRTGGGLGAGLGAGPDGSVGGPRGSAEGGDRAPEGGEAAPEGGAR